MISSTFSALIVFVTFLMLHSLVFHFLKITQRVRWMAILLGVCLFLLFFLLPFFRSLNIEEKISKTSQTGLLSLAVFTFIWFGYLQFYFIIERGISPRFLIHFLEAGKRGLTLQEANTLYPFEDVLSRRVDQMVASNLLEELSTPSGKYLKNSKKGQWMGKVFGGLKGFLQLGNGG